MVVLAMLLQAIQATAVVVVVVILVVMLALWSPVPLVARQQCDSLGRHHPMDDQLLKIHLKCRQQCRSLGHHHPMGDQLLKLHLKFRRVGSVTSSCFRFLGSVVCVQFTLLVAASRALSAATPAAAAAADGGAHSGLVRPLQAAHSSGRVGKELWLRRRAMKLRGFPSEVHCTEDHADRWTQEWPCGRSLYESIFFLVAFFYMGFAAP